MPPYTLPSDERYVRNHINTVVSQMSVMDKMLLLSKLQKDYTQLLEDGTLEPFIRKYFSENPNQFTRFVNT